MKDNIKMRVYDDISQMIEDTSGRLPPAAPEELEKAMSEMASSIDEEKTDSHWSRRYHKLPAYVLDIKRDDSDMYFEALKKAILAITRGRYGSIDHKGYKIYYYDTPRIRRISLEDGHKEYSYYAGFRCEALTGEYHEEYHSEEERKAFLDPDNALFEKTVALLDKEIELLDEGKWIKKKKRLNIHEFKDYSPRGLQFAPIAWDDRNQSASSTFAYLLEDATMRASGHIYNEDIFTIFSDIIRRMLFFADYGKRNFLYTLEGFVLYEWKPKTKHDQYIWRCMKEFGQGDLPDWLLDKCTLFYFLEDPQGWEALAYIIPIAVLWEMCHDYDPDNVKDRILKVFDLIPDEGYRERIERFIEEDRARMGKGENTDDQENF